LRREALFLEFLENASTNQKKRRKPKSIIFELILPKK